MDPLSVVGAVASIVQLLHFVHSASSGLIKLIDNIREVPDIILKLKSTTESFEAKTRILKQALAALAKPLLLPAGTQDSLEKVLLKAHSEIRIIETAVLDYEKRLTNASSLRLREKLRFHFVDEKGILEALRKFEDSEKALNRIETSVHLYGRPKASTSGIH